MTYVNGRLVHDADSHLMELSDCLDPYFERRLLSRFHAMPAFHSRKDHGTRPGQSAAAHADPAFRAGVDANIMLRKNYEAHGAFLPADRPHALNLLGFASQLVFTTFCLGNFGLDQGEDMEMCYAAASAHNRMMTDFCKAALIYHDVGLARVLRGFERTFHECHRSLRRAVPLTAGRTRN